LLGLLRAACIRHPHLALALNFDLPIFVSDASEQYDLDLFRRAFALLLVLSITSPTTEYSYTPSTLDSIIRLLSPHARP